jgi:hypothetical protein
LSAFAAIIQSAHAGMAWRMQQPHWNMNDPDAKRYAQALGNAMRHLSFTVAQKYVDFTALIVVMGEMELPRILISAQLAQQQRSQTPRRGPAQVFQFNPNPGQQPPPAQTPQAPTPPPSSPPEAAGDYPIDAVFPLGIEPDIGDGAA